MMFLTKEEELGYLKSFQNVILFKEDSLLTVVDWSFV